MLVSVGIQVCIYIVCFLAMWYGSGLVIEPVTHLAKHWKLPVFFVSFFLLGLLTSLPEAMIGVFAVATHHPELFVGNLVGGVIVLFLAVIPLLGLVGNGVRTPHQLSRSHMLLILAVVLAPLFCAFDLQITRGEALGLVGLYCSLFLLFSAQSGIRSHLLHLPPSHTPKKTLQLIGKMGAGVIIMAIAGQTIVQLTFVFASLLQLSNFVVSLIIVALGANLPELSLVLRVYRLHTVELALADYLGSATANTLLLGILILLTGGTVSLPQHVLSRLLLLTPALVLFFLFVNSHQKLSRKESLVLLSLYVVFVASEVVFSRGN